MRDTTRAIGFAIAAMLVSCPGIAVGQVTCTEYAVVSPLLGELALVDITDVTSDGT